MVKNILVYSPSRSAKSQFTIPRTRAVGVIILAIILGGVGVGLSYASFFSTDVRNDASVDIYAVILDELVAVQETLAHEVKIRQGLVKEMAELSKQVDSLIKPAALYGIGRRSSQEGQAYKAGPDTKWSGTLIAHNVDEYAQLIANSDEDESVDSGYTPAFDGEALVEAGLSEKDAARLRAHWEALEISKLYIDDQATKEGWFNSQQHHEKLRELDVTMRSDLDEDSYDQYLYASRKPNRVVVRDVVDQSLVLDRIFLPGDTILRYDGQRVFTSKDLRDGISSGQQDDRVVIEIQRGDNNLFVDVFREPLGILTGLQIQPPLNQ